MKEMEALIFAAGFGTRLKPLTDSKPKALVELNCIPLLDIAISRLKKIGIKRIVVNVHHFSEMMIKHLSKKYGDEIIISNENDLLLDTGGGLRHAEKYFSKSSPILIHNVDIISSISLEDFYKKHIASDAIASMAVSKRKSSRMLLANSGNNLVGWRNNKTNEEIFVNDDLVQNEFAFSGVHIIEPEIFNLLPNENVFSIIKFYLNIAAKHKINLYDQGNVYWSDVGTVEKLKETENYLTKNEIKI